jgi:hypothetical protein
MTVASTLPRNVSAKEHRDAIQLLVYSLLDE